MIKREYHTAEECARCWLREDWDSLSDWVVTEAPNWWERWSFYEEGEEPGDLAPCDAPMWSTWFEPGDWCDVQWIEDNAAQVAALGFTLIYHEGDFWGLGIDGAGYDFYEAHWVPLYRLRGFHWHDEAEEVA